MARGWRRLLKVDLHNLYASPNIITTMTRAGHVACMGDIRNSCKNMVVKPEWNIPLVKCG
jgi:hypothetical protein